MLSLVQNVNISFNFTEYLMREDVNVFSMDWRAIQNPDYSNMLNATVQAGFNTG